MLTRYVYDGVTPALMKFTGSHSDFGVPISPLTRIIRVYYQCDLPGEDAYLEVHDKKLIRAKALTMRDGEVLSRCKDLHKYVIPHPLSARRTERTAQTPLHGLVPVVDMGAYPPV